MNHLFINYLKKYSLPSRGLYLVLGLGIWGVFSFFNLAFPLNMPKINTFTPSSSTQEKVANKTSSESNQNKTKAIKAKTVEQSSPTHQSSSAPSSHSFSKKNQASEKTKLSVSPFPIQVHFYQNVLQLSWGELSSEHPHAPIQIIVQVENQKPQTFLAHKQSHTFFYQPYHPNQRYSVDVNTLYAGHSTLIDHIFIAAQQDTPVYRLMIQNDIKKIKKQAPQKKSKKHSFSQKSSLGPLSFYQSLLKGLKSHPFVHHAHEQQLSYFVGNSLNEKDIQTYFTSVNNRFDGQNAYFYYHGVPQKAQLRSDTGVPLHLYSLTYDLDGQQSFLVPYYQHPSLSLAKSLYKKLKPTPVDSKTQLNSVSSEQSTHHGHIVFFMDKNLQASLNAILHHSRQAPIYTNSFAGQCYLDLSGRSINNLSGLSDLQMPLLRFLDLSNNNLTDIPSNCFSHMPGLEILGLNQNQISHLSTNIFWNLPKLKGLYLSGNLLSILPVSLLAQQRQLVNLDLSHNWLNQIPSTFFSAQNNLKKLNLSFNRLTQLDSSVFSNLSSVQVLDIQNNPIMEISDDFFDPLIGIRQLNIPHSILHSPAIIALLQKKAEGKKALHIGYE